MVAQFTGFLVAWSPWWYGWFLSDLVQKLESREKGFKLDSLKAFRFLYGQAVSAKPTNALQKSLIFGAQDILTCTWGIIVLRQQTRLLDLINYRHYLTNNIAAQGVQNVYQSVRVSKICLPVEWFEGNLVSPRHVTLNESIIRQYKQRHCRWWVNPTIQKDGRQSKDRMLVLLAPGKRPEAIKLI